MSRDRDKDRNKDLLQEVPPSTLGTIGHCHIHGIREQGQLSVTRGWWHFLGDMGATPRSPQVPGVPSQLSHGQWMLCPTSLSPPGSGDRAGTGLFPPATGSVPKKWFRVCLEIPNRDWDWDRDWDWG